LAASDYQIIPDCSSGSLSPFIEKNIEPGSRIITEAWKGYTLEEKTYEHYQDFQMKPDGKKVVLPCVHLTISLVKRSILSTQ